MKRYILALMALLFCIIGVDSRQAEAYSVTVQKDSIYAEVIPDSIVNNAAAIFKKHVKKAMKYDAKYKDADNYTYMTKVPDKYRDFISVAKQIQDSDKIMIRNPFFIYDPKGNGTYNYYFAAEKNGKKLCLFNIDVDPYTGKISFEYDKSMNQYFKYDEKTMKEALFYKIDNVIYAQTPEKIHVIRNQSYLGGMQMDGGDSESGVKTKGFMQKKYEDKKEEIFVYLNKIKSGKIIEESDKNLKQELKDEYVEPENDAKDARKSDGIGMYIMIGIGIFAIAVIVGGIVLWKNGTKEK